MIDIKFLRENRDVVRENIKKKFQDSKLPLVDEVIGLDVEKRQTQQKADSLRASRNKLSKQIGALMGQGKRDEAEQVKAQVKAQSDELLAAEAKEKELDERILKIMMTIPNIIDPSVPIGRDDSENVEVQRYGEPVTPDFPVPYHTEIMERFNGIDLDAARRVAGNGFYYLMGDIARLHSAVIAYLDEEGRRRWPEVVTTVVERVRAEGGRGQFHAIGINEIKGFAVDGGVLVGHAPAFDPGGVEDERAEFPQAGREVRTFREAHLHQIEHGELAGVALALRFAAEAGAYLEKPQGAFREPAEIAHVFVEMRGEHGAQAVFGVQPEDLLFHD